MPDDSLPAGDKAVLAFFEIVAFALGWNGVDRLLSGTSLLIVVPIFVATILTSYAGFKWPQLKLKVGPGFAANVDRIANNRRYQIIYAVIALVLVASASIGIYRHYHRSAVAVASPALPPSTTPPTVSRS